MRQGRVGWAGFLTCIAPSAMALLHCGPVAHEAAAPTGAAAPAGDQGTLQAASAPQTNSLPAIDKETFAALVGPARHV
jgi:hypothetical protein